MGELAARTIFSNDTGPLAGTGLDTLAKNQGAILELEGAQAPQSKTITDGSISPTAAYVIVDTEGSAAADDLDVINPVLSASENLHDGMVVYLKAADSGRVVTVKNSSSANGINTYDGNDYVLSTTHWLKLQLRSGKWYEVEGRAMGTALAAAGAAAAASLPATTTSRGIARVATLADMEPGAVVENGPAFLAAGVHTSVAAAAGKVPVADSNGKLDAWVSQQTQFATCATAAATAAKKATLTGFSLVKGARVLVTFANTNTVAGPLTLNVNSTGAKPICDESGQAVSATNPAYFPAGCNIEFVYDGTNWRYIRRCVKGYYTSTAGYRLFSDGFLEQFGVSSVPHVVSTNINFPTNFSIGCSYASFILDGTYSAATSNEAVTYRGTTYFTALQGTGATRNANWYACGY